MKGFLFVATLPLILAACSSDGVPMIGLDDSGNPVERYVEEAILKEEFNRASGQVEDSTFVALKNELQSPAAMAQAGSLREVVVGLGFNLSGGLGPVVTMGVSPKVRFVFSNRVEPVIP
jgi:hypothetical protein